MAQEHAWQRTRLHAAGAAAWLLPNLRPPKFLGNRNKRHQLVVSMWRVYFLFYFVLFFFFLGDKRWQKKLKHLFMVLLVREFRALLEISITPRRFVRNEIRIFIFFSYVVKFLKQRKILKQCKIRRDPECLLRRMLRLSTALTNLWFSRVTLLQNPKD